MTQDIDHIPKEKTGFLQDPVLKIVFDAFAGEGEMRVVGGAVRNVLMGYKVGDIDLATTLVPDQVIKLAKKAGIRAVPTGIDHGTITLVVDHKGFEVTTLRADVETYGRHAKVAFGTDWRVDAERRDFTVNALYCDRDGRLYDPLGTGLEDITKRKIRFVGKADARIAEDYLRILRFFRITAEYGEGDLDEVGLAACAAGKDGLQQLSLARVRAELLKLLSAPRAAEIMPVMAKAGILAEILPGADRFKFFDQLCALEHALELAPDAILRLAALYGGKSPVTKLQTHMELAKKESQRLEVLADGFSKPKDMSAAKQALYRAKTDPYRDLVLMAWAKSDTNVDDQAWHEIYALPDNWPMPELPLTGNDIIARGIDAGPKVGEVLGVVEEKWIEAGFPKDQDFVTKSLDEILT